MTEKPNRHLTITHAAKEQVGSVYQFHTLIAKKGFVLGRDETFIAKLIDDSTMFIVTDDTTGKIVGLCYTMYDESGSRWEVGGLYVVDEFQELGVAAALGRVAVATLFIVESELIDEPSEDGRLKLIAHVHRDNDDPIKLLLKSFYESGVEEFENPPQELRKDVDGKVYARLFTFCQGTLTALAGWFEGFKDTVGSGDKAATLVVDSQVMLNRAKSVATLRGLGKQCATAPVHGCSIFAGGA